MVGLTVQNFVTPAVGICVLVAMIRGIVSRGGTSLGNFWQDLVRSVYYVLLPLSIVVALILVSQGVVQTLGHAVSLTTLSGGSQVLALGPVASQIAIKQLGTNGGGFFNVNSAIPFENPNALTNFVELLAIILIPAALTYTYGRMAGRQREGWAIFAAMLAIYIAFVAVIIPAEQHGTPAAARRRHPDRGDLRLDRRQHGRQGAAQRDRRARRCGRPRPRSPPTARSTPRSSPSPASAAPCRWPTSATSEVVFGGVGTGLYSMLLFVLLAVFIGGLMVGRTPEYLGKKIQAREIKLISLGVLFTPLAVLVTSGLAIAIRAGTRSIYESGPAGLLGDPLRLPLAGQQQRLRLRRLHRLHPAQRARQPRRLRHHLRRPARRRDDDPRPLRPDHPRARRRRLARRQEDLAGRARARCGPTPRPSSSS